MHDNAKLIERFYFAFQNRDYKTMAEAYREDATFWDPVFRDLKGWEIAAMWRMLCERGKDLQIEVSGIEADDKRGRAHWEARYTFSKTKRPVHNKIDAEFEFVDGKIKAHKDSFDLWRWLRMAIGPAGTVFGWTPPMQNAVRQEARHGLSVFIQKEGLGR